MPKMKCWRRRDNGGHVLATSRGFDRDFLGHQRGPDVRQRRIRRFSCPEPSGRRLRSLRPVAWPLLAGFPDLFAEGI
jgi:hypothetical protein